MELGFVGLGNMGGAIAKRLIAAKHSLTIWNRTASKVQPLVEQGARGAKSPEDALNADVVFSMLADDSTLESVLLDSGAFDRARKGVIHVCLSTISASLAKRLAAFHARRGQRYVSAPVLGRPDAANAGQLVILAAGDEDARKTVQPLFDAFGKKTWSIGVEPEKANVLKLANNFMLAAAIESMSEAAALVGGYGMTAAQLLDITNSSLFDCPAYRGYGKAIAERAFEPAGFAVDLGAKDVRLSLEAAEAAKVPMPVASVVRDSLLQAKAMGHAKKDWAILELVSRTRAGQS